MGFTFKVTNAQPVLKRFEQIPSEIGGDRLGLYVAQRAGALMDEYVPMESGTLAQSYRVEPFIVEYHLPYAAYQYYGTNFNFSKDKHPNATAKWGQAMMNAKGDQLIREIRKYIHTLVR